jgi:DHA1 family multidrug resistance protein-like MFS transporter
VAEAISLRALPRRTIALSGAVVLLSLSFFMTVSLLAVYLVRTEGIPTAQAGVVLGCLTFASQGLQLPVGLAADRWGRSRLLGVAAPLTCLAYAGLSLTSSLGLLIPAGLGLGLGNAITGLVLKTMMVESASNQRTTVLSLRNIAVNTGAVVGPAVGAAVFHWFTIALLSAGSVYVLCWLVFRRADIGPTRMEAPTQVLRNLAVLLRSRLLVALTLTSIGFWFIYTQFTLTFPLFAADRFRLGGKVALFFVVSAIAAIAFQYPVSRFIGTRPNRWTTLALGSATFVLAYAVLAIAGASWLLIIFVIVFVLGEVAVIPTLDVLATELAPQTMLAAGLGVVSLGWAVGGLLGNLLGAIAYAHFASVGHFSVFWLINALLALLTAGAFLVLQRTGRST